MSGEPRPLTLESVLDGRYRLDRRLGKGSAATVFLAFDLELERRVAIKILDGLGTLEDPRRLLAEAQALGKLRHPHVLEVYGVGYTQDRVYLCLEYAPGGTLQDLVPKSGVDPGRARELARPILEALVEAHAHEVLHRDVKPGNVLISEGGLLKLADFGLASFQKRGVRTQTGMVLGTPEFMAPELFMGTKASKESDLYAWGCTASWLLQGRPPFVGSLREVVRGHTTGEIPKEQLPGVLGRAISQALSKDPWQRGSAASLVEILASKEDLEAPWEKLLGRDPKAPEEDPRSAQTARISRPEAVPPSSPMPPKVASSSPGRGLRWWGGVLASSLALVGIGLWLRSGREAPQGPGRAELESRALLQGWPQKLEGLEVEALLKASLEAIPTKSSNYQKDMLRARRDPQSEVAQEAREVVGKFPWIQELEADRPSLAQAFSGPELDPSEKWKLLKALEPLERLDAFAESFGIKPPFGIEELAKSFRPRAKFAAYAGLPEGLQDPPPGRPLGPGLWKLFQWKSGWDRDYP